MCDVGGGYGGVDGGMRGNLWLIMLRAIGPWAEESETAVDEVAEMNLDGIWYKKRMKEAEPTHTQELRKKEEIN